MAGSELAVEADLTFTVDIPGRRTVSGALTGAGASLELQVSDPFLFAGRSDSGAIQSLARGLADRGLSIKVTTVDGPLVTLGVRRASWLQRRLTGSRHIRIERGAGLWSLLRGRTRAPREGALPTAELLPPPTLFPFVPTMARRLRGAPASTHDPQHGGRPRLVMPVGPYPSAGEEPTSFPLRESVTTIGADALCDIRLTGLEPVHAEVHHDVYDEFVLVRLEGSAATTRVNGAPIDSAILRTGTGIDLGPWHLSFYREEYADHGRPNGGRIGGELGHQQPQRGAVARHRGGAR